MSNKLLRRNLVLGGLAGVGGFLIPNKLLAKSMGIKCKIPRLPLDGRVKSLKIREGLIGRIIAVISQRDNENYPQNYVHEWVQYFPTWKEKCTYQVEFDICQTPDDRVNDFEGKMCWFPEEDLERI